MSMEFDTEGLPGCGKFEPYLGGVGNLNQAWVRIHVIVPGMKKFNGEWLTSSGLCSMFEGMRI